MAIAVQLDPQKTQTGCRVPTIVPVLEFEPGVAYELPDEQAQALLSLADGPFMRVALKVARAQAAEQEAEQTTETAPDTADEQQPAAPEAAPGTAESEAS